MAMTITATEGGVTFNGITLRVKVLTSIAASQGGAGSNSASLSAAAEQVSITTTVTGSLVYGAGVRGTTVSPTVLGNTTAIDAVNDTTNNFGRDTFRTTSATGTPGATTVGYSTSETGGIAALEILPNGTITEDASGPAVATTNTATTIATASFTPPAGSLLVAMVSAGGGAGVVTMTVSGGSLTWTERVKANASGLDYAGVWTAPVPAAGGLAPLPLVISQAAKRAAFY